MSDWQPIETAPKDGREILAVLRGCVSGSLRGVVIKWDNDEGWMFDGAEISNAWDVVYWTSLPELPERKKP